MIESLRDPGLRKSCVRVLMSNEKRMEAVHERYRLPARGARSPSRDQGRRAAEWSGGLLAQDWPGQARAMAQRLLAKATPFPSHRPSPEIHGTIVADDGVESGTDEGRSAIAFPVPGARPDHTTSTMTTRTARKPWDEKTYRGCEESPISTSWTTCMNVTPSRGATAGADEERPPTISIRTTRTVTTSTTTSRRERDDEGGRRARTAQRDRRRRRDLGTLSRTTTTEPPNFEIPPNWRTTRHRNPSLRRRKHETSKTVRRR